MKAAQWPHIARYCDTIAAIPCITRCLFREVSTPPNWLRYQVTEFHTGPSVRYPILLHRQGQVSAEGILHLVNPNVGSSSGMRIFEPRILEPNSGVEFLSPMFSNKKSPLENSPSRNSPPKIHINKFTPEFGLKNSHCTSAGPFC